MSDLLKEIDKRLTFAIISHPDAGKTTITEKLLYFGGAIHMAGAVKAKSNARKTVSDFMAMEKERGISISTSVMGFDYRGRRVNLLDTPGHADFSEDTYRTLTAVDSTLMVIDSVKGVEERTRKLCEICRMRTTPIITFMNKCDRDGRDPIELLDELEAELGITAVPMSWPIGQGKLFKGVYNLYENRVVFFRAHGAADYEDESIVVEGIDDPKLDEVLGDDADELREQVELIQGVYPEFDKDAYLRGEVSPVFFGSALNNFGVKELLDCFVDIAPPPVARKTEERTVDPHEDKFSGVIFKIHANLDPKHRDRIAFMRICSGTFERNKAYLHVRSGKNLKSSNPTAFMAQDRNIIDKAYPGDIIGLHDTGNLHIGDALTEGENLKFIGIPRFAPQIFKKVINKDPMKSKQLEKGLSQLSEEGVVQLFSRLYGPEKILGVVGMLQFDVIQARLESEYKAKCIFEPVEYTSAAWVRFPDKKREDEFVSRYDTRLVKDNDDNFVLLARNKYMIQRIQDEEKDVEFFYTSDFE